LDARLLSARNRILLKRLRAFWRSILRMFLPPTWASLNLGGSDTGHKSSHLELFHDRYNFVFQGFIGHLAPTEVDFVADKNNGDLDN
jgi:hypothetical protein